MGLTQVEIDKGVAKLREAGFTGEIKTYLIPIEFVFPPPSRRYCRAGSAVGHDGGPAAGADFVGGRIEWPDVALRDVEFGRCRPGSGSCRMGSVKSSSDE